MVDTPLQRTEALRDEMFATLQELDLFKAVQALDDAVFAMGGKRRVPRQGGVTIHLGAQAASATASEKPNPLQRDQGRLSQPDAAEMVLKEIGKPMPVRDLVPLVEAKGVTMGANDPVASLGSQLSRNPDRFLSKRMNGTHYWWLVDVAFPPGWNETADPDLLAESAGSSVHSNQEGGDGHEANNTP